MKTEMCLRLCELKQNDQRSDHGVPKPLQINIKLYAVELFNTNVCLAMKRCTLQQFATSECRPSVILGFSGPIIH